ncbi:MAG: hypothetical protein ABI744_01540 [Chloroflexota bacterium]
MRTFQWLIVAIVLLASAGCAFAGPISDIVHGGSGVSLDSVLLAADGRSVDVTVIGGHPLSDGEPCGADYTLASTSVIGATLEILIVRTAERVGSCVLTELICCERHFTVELPTDRAVDRARDLSASFERDLFLVRPSGLDVLHGLPPDWKLRTEWASWGGTWTRLYSPLIDPPPGSPDTLIFKTTFGGHIITEPEALQPPVLVNGVEAQYQRYPDVSNQIQLQWLVDGQLLTLETFERDFSIDELTSLANSASSE